MTTRPKLIIHAGHPKCGSTAIRSLLRQNGTALAQRGCFILGDGFQVAPDNNISGWPLWYIERAKTETPGTLSEALRGTLIANRHLDIRCLILSAENLSDCNTARLLQPALSEFDTRLIYYMRRQDHFLIASWRQWALKRGLDLEQHVMRRISERRPPFEATLAYWEGLLGREQIHARFVDPRFLDGGDLAVDFFNAISFDNPVATVADASNPSPDRAILIFLQQNHGLFRDVHDDTPIHVLSELDDGPVRKLQIGSRLQRLVHSAFEPENQRILRRHGAPGHGRLPVIIEDAVGEVSAGLDDADRARLDRIFARMLGQCVGSRHSHANNPLLAENLPIC